MQNTSLNIQFYNQILKNNQTFPPDPQTAVIDRAKSPHKLVGRNNREG
jgi:hypothetical protein